MRKIFFDRDERAGGGDVSVKRAAAVEKELLYNYRAVSDRIKKDLEKLADKIGRDGILEYAEMAKYNRLNNLMANINAEISKLTRASKSIISSFSRDSMILSYNRITLDIKRVLDRGTGVDVVLNWGMLNPDVIKASVENPLYLTAMEDLKSSAMIQVKRELTQGLIEGQSYYKIGKRIKERLDVSASRARTIARTEAGRAWSAGHDAAHERAEALGIDVDKVWLATLDARTRDSHRTMDQQKADKHGLFTLPGGEKVKGPRLGGPASEVVNCRCRMVTVVRGFEPTKRIAREIDAKNPKAWGEQKIIKTKSYREWEKKT